MVCFHSKPNRLPKSIRYFSIGPGAFLRVMDRLLKATAPQNAFFILGFMIKYLSGSGRYTHRSNGPKNGRLGEISGFFKSINFKKRQEIQEALSQNWSIRHKGMQRLTVLKNRCSLICKDILLCNASGALLQPSATCILSANPVKIRPQKKGEISMLHAPFHQHYPIQPGSMTTYPLPFCRSDCNLQPGN